MSLKSVAALEFQLAARLSGPSRYGYELRKHTEPKRTLASFARVSILGHSSHASMSRSDMNTKPSLVYGQSRPFSSSSRHHFTDAASRLYALRPAREVEDTSSRPDRPSYSSSAAQQSLSAAQPIRHLTHYAKPGNVFEGELEPIYVYSNLWKRRTVMYAPSTVRSHVQHQINTKTKSQLVPKLTRTIGQMVEFESRQLSVSESAKRSTTGEVSIKVKEKFTLKKIISSVFLAVVVSLIIKGVFMLYERFIDEVPEVGNSSSGTSKRGFDGSLARARGPMQTVDDGIDDETHNSEDHDIDMAALGLKEVGISTK